MEWLISAKCISRRGEGVISQSYYFDQMGQHSHPRNIQTSRSYSLKRLQNGLQREVSPVIHISTHTEQITYISRDARRSHSPLWNRAIERYREELTENDDYDAITEIASLDDLLDYAKTMEPMLPRERNALASMRRLGPTLKFVDDFSAVIAVCFGADAKFTALVWGSIRVMLTLASSAGDTLKEVLDMLEELSLTLPRFRAYEDNLPMDRSLEAALVDVYAEVICFYARCIHFFRTHPHVLLRRDAWEEFRGDFTQTIRRIRRMSSIVESEAESTRMRQDRSKYGEVIELMETLRDTKIQDEEAASFYLLPSKLRPRFWGREDVLAKIDEALSPSPSSKTLKTFALCGLGGIGKTQIAVEYANRNRDKYRAIFWVEADNVINMGHSFVEVAKILNLAKADEPPDSSRATLQVKGWLADAGMFAEFCPSSAVRNK